MSDHNSAYLFGEIFRTIAEYVPDPATRQILALKFWMLKEKCNFDFADYSMDAENALVKLHLARKGVDPDYPKDGVVTLYGPES